MMSTPEEVPDNSIRAAMYSSQEYSPVNDYGQAAAFYPGNQSGPDLSAGPLEFMPITDLSTVFDFDKSVDGIRTGFRRLTLVTAGNGWQGLRTDLVTGTGPNDLHGCITWFFDSQGRMQQISFRGWTGDCGPLKQILADRFLLTAGGKSGTKETMKLGSWGSTSSAAVFQMPQVIRQDTPQEQFAVMLELNRSSSYSISPAMQAAMQ